MADRIQEKLQLTWSPEQIENGMPDESVSFKTIQLSLPGACHKGQSLNVLRQKGKRQKPRETRWRFNVDTSIQKRPQEVRERKVLAIGSWTRLYRVVAKAKATWLRS
ncbi:hypothetical protein [Mesobacillus zeae]|uniref:hypothetical protein n=1 Tax=Mesobacillus zeae TaxID=1917180 RepID=UPI002684F861